MMGVALEGTAMKKQGKRTTKRPKKAATKDLSAKAASTVKGGFAPIQWQFTEVSPKKGITSSS